MMETISPTRSAPQSSTASGRRDLARGAGRPAFWALRLALALVLLGVQVASAQPLVADETIPRPFDELDTTVDNILDSPELFVGETVIVAATFTGRVAPGAFTVQDFDPFFMDQLLVVGAREPLVAHLAEDTSVLIGDVVLVAGYVQVFEPDRLASELGVDLDPNLAWGVEGTPVLVARLVDFPRFGCLDAAPAGGLTFGAVSPFEQAIRDGSETIDAILESPRLYLGQIVTVSGVANAQGLEPWAFTLPDSDPFFENDLLVVTLAPLPTLPGVNPFLGEPLVDRELVQVAGQVRLFDRAEVARELGTSLDSPVFERFEGVPFVLARMVDVAGFVDTDCFVPGQAPPPFDTPVAPPTPPRPRAQSPAPSVALAAALEVTLRIQGPAPGRSAGRRGGRGVARGVLRGRRRRPNSARRDLARTLREGVIRFGVGRPGRAIQGMEVRDLRGAE